MQATHVYMHHLGIYQKHRVGRQCAVEIEITTIKATGYHAVIKRRSNLSVANPGCSSGETGSLKVEITHRDTEHACFSYKRLMGNGPHEAGRRTVIGPWRPGHWRGGWRERPTRVSNPN